MTERGGVTFRVNNRSTSLADFLLFCYRCLVKTTLSVSERGVVSLPAKMRAMFGIRSKDVVIAETTPEGILLRPTVTLPVELYSEARIAEFDAEEAALAKVLKRKKR